MFDLSITKLLVLAVIALVIFGPNELPRIARQAGRMLRDLRQIAEGAKADLRAGLGPEFEGFEFEDLNPRRFVQKHLLDDPAPEGAENGTANVMAAATKRPDPDASASDSAASGPATVEVDDRIPFDLEATLFPGGTTNPQASRPRTREARSARAPLAAG